MEILPNISFYVQGLGNDHWPMVPTEHTLFEPELNLLSGPPMLSEFGRRKNDAGFTPK